jgi:hypothetical protein
MSIRVPKDHENALQGRSRGHWKMRAKAFEVTPNEIRIPAARQAHQQSYRAASDGRSSTVCDKLTNETFFL